jgi:Tfp pilus assembly protein PilO
VKKQVSLTPVLAIALVIVLAVGYFALVRPKQAAGSKLDEEIAALETQLATAARPEAVSPAAPEPVEINVADVFRLAKAMPDRDDMASVILELNAIAVSTGVEFVAIQPQTPVTKGEYHAVPVALTFRGNYYDLTDFLYRLRNLVRVRDGVLDASGRLYTLDAFALQESEGGFPRIEAVITVSAYTFGVPPVAPGATPPPPADGSTTGTTATTTGTTATTTTGATTTTTTTTTGATPQGPPADPTGDGNPQAAGGTP